MKTLIFGTIAIFALVLALGYWLDMNPWWTMFRQRETVTMFSLVYAGGVIVGYCCRR